MRRVLIMGGLALVMFSCGNSGENTSGTGRSESAGEDTTKNMTTNSGAAGTGGVGAGFGTGGSAGTDTNTTPGVAGDTSHTDHNH